MIIEKRVFFAGPSGIMIIELGAFLSVEGRSGGV
jgi:hypothetical protein